MKNSGKGKKKFSPQPTAGAENLAPKTALPKPPKPETPPQSSFFELKTKRQERLAIAAILGLTWLAYFNALFGEFVYDDAFQILKNPTLQSLANLPAMFTQGVWQFMSQSEQNEAIGLYYRPMFNSLLIVNYQLFGFAPFGWHLVSLLLHVAATWLVYLLAKRWEWPRPAAALAALLFGLHPVHVESVAWVSGVPDPLAAVFLLSALLAYERSRDAAAQLWLLLSLVFALAALFTKEVAILLPALIGLRELLAARADETLAAKLGRAVKRALPFAVAALLYLAARYAVLGFISKSEPKAVGITGAQVLLTLPSVLLAYVRTLFVPYPLAVIYDHNYVNALSDPRCWLAALAVLVIVGVSLWLLRRSRLGHSRLEMLALALLVLFLLPVLNLKTFNPEESIIHDRYLYLPSIGFCLLLALGVYRLRERAVAVQKQLVAVFLICALFFGLTVYQNTTWESEEAMITQALQVSPKRAFLHNLLGAYYTNQNKLAEAAQSYSQAVQLNPRYYDAFSNLGDVYLKQSKYAEAEQAYAQSVSHGSIYPQTYYNLADVQAKQRKYAEAEQTLQRTVQMKPGYADAYFYLGWVYQQQNRFEQAATAYQQALNVKADYLEPRLNLAYVLSEQGKLKEAEAQLEIVKRRAPTHAVLLYTLGEVYRKSNRLAEAITTMSQLLNTQPRHQMGQLSLGLAYEQSGETVKAKSHLQQAIDIAPQEQAAQTAREHLAKLP